jgi:hypothetical protein
LGGCVPAAPASPADTQALAAAPATGLALCASVPGPAAPPPAATGATAAATAASAGMLRSRPKAAPAMLPLRAAELAAACASRLAACAALAASPCFLLLLGRLLLASAAGCRSDTLGDPQVGVGMKVDRSSPGAPDCLSLSAALVVRRRFRLGGSMGCTSSKPDRHWSAMCGT